MRLVKHYTRVRGIRVLVRCDLHLKSVQIKPEASDLNRSDLNEVVGLFEEIGRWAAGFIEAFPQWSVNGYKHPDRAFLEAERKQPLDLDSGFATDLGSRGF